MSGLQLTNKGSDQPLLQSNVTSTGLVGGWVTATPSTGTITPGQIQVISVQYDIGQNEFQGIYTADILLTTNAQPLAKVLTLLSHYMRHWSSLLSE